MTGVPTSVFVVSDLHLGGGEGFRMCSQAGQTRLAELFGWIAGLASDQRRIELVIAGDIVDFLAEENKGGGWSSFTGDEDAALRKLEQIVKDTKPVWEKLAACVAAKCRVTLMLGNHDIELSLPRVRARLLEKLGPGYVEFLYDNQAYTRGQLLVEHGNRYEGWNLVDHDDLRAARSRLSRGLPAGDFNTQPGSDLVVKVMNKVKARYSWIDLLKPETSAVIPILVALAPGLWKSVAAGIEAKARQFWREHQFADDGMPREKQYVSEQKPGAPVPEPAPFPDEDIFQWVNQTLAAPENQYVSGELDALKEDVLFAAMRTWAEKDGRSFEVEREHDTYQRAAATLARNGYRVIVFGHTHHAKRVALADPSYALYLNTGTWADLMRIPEDALVGDKTEARAAFGLFFDDLKHNRIADCRRLLPTFARIDFDAADAIVRSDVLFFDGPDQVTPVTTDGIMARLGMPKT